MSLKRILLASVFVSTFVGCSATPPVPTGRYETPRPLGEVAQLLGSQAKRCWAGDVTPIRFGLRVATQTGGADFYIRVHRIYWPEGLKREPFAVVRVAGNQSSVTVDVDEGEIGCSLVRGCFKIGLTEHVKRWLAGEIRCFEFENSLYHW